MTADFVTTLQVLIAVRIEAVESGVINKNLVAGGKENSIVMEGDPAQTTVTAAAFPVNTVVIPIDYLICTGRNLDRSGKHLRDFRPDAWNELPR